MNNVNNSGVNKKRRNDHNGDKNHSGSKNNGTKEYKIRRTSALSNLDLPIASYRESIIESVKKYQTTIIVGETGSGKSTQIPQYMAEYILDGKSNTSVVCTQPRRVAAVTIAQKVASERKCKIGGEVGYSIRFEDKCGPYTKIKFVTDGVLLRECMGNKQLDKYSVVILDEAHERSLQTDILMGLLRQLQDTRPDLRIIIMSATLQVELFCSFFKDTNTVTIPGRQYPVSVMYTPQPEPDFVDAAMLTCLQIHEEAEPGGVLVFLPGQEDIESLQLLLEEHLPTVTATATAAPNTDSSCNSAEGQNGSVPPAAASADGTAAVVTVHTAAGLLKDFDIRPLYAAMPADEQLRVFEPAPPGVRKFVLSTNIAETSVTISGIKYVVDIGYVKTRLMSPQTGVEMLKVMPVSKSQANQRAGRAGRESAGICYRLFTEEAFCALETTTTPEIQRINIAQVVLQLKTLGVVSPTAFPFLSPPSEIALRKAFELLLILGALNKDQTLTPHGEKMASLPLDPTFAHLLLRSHDLGCVSEALTAVSLLSSDNIFLQPHRDEEKRVAGQAHRNFASRDGDLPTLVNIYASWLKANKDKKWTQRNYLSYRSLQHACSVREQLCTLLQKLGIDTSVSCHPEREPFLRCLVTGLSLNVAQRVTAHQGGGGSGGGHNRNGSSTINSVNNKFSFSQNSGGNSNSSSSNGRFVSSSGDDAPYRTVRGKQPVHIHPSSVLFSMVNSRKLPEYVVFAELLTTSKQYMRNVSAIEGAWLAEMFPSNFKSAAAPPATDTNNGAGSAAAAVTTPGKQRQWN